MGWLSTFKRKPNGNERNRGSGGSAGRGQREAGPRSAAATADTVQQARTRARRRLIGAAVLVVAGVIGFPLLFETQPRPVAIDIPIEIPRKDGAPALAMPAARPSPIATAASPPTSPPATGSTPAPVLSSGAIITETDADAGRDVSKPIAPRPAPAPAVAAAKPLAPASHAAVADRARPPAAAPVAARGPDAERAAALLDGQPVARADTASARPTPPVGASAPSTAASATPRFIVQAGAFIDAAAARDTRAKLEHLGLKTYTQVADTPSGPRVRVRLGPFASRADADKALARAKAAGLAAVVITL